MTFSLLVVATLLSGLFVGLIPTLVDGLAKSLQSRLNLGDGKVDWFGRLFFLVWLPAMPLIGLALDIGPSKEILFYSLVALTLGVAWLAHVRSLPSLLANGLFLGLAYSGVATATVHLMTKVLFADSVQNPLLTLAALNLGFMAVGLGALKGPYLIMGIERWWGYRQGLLGVSMMCILPAALAILSEPTLFPRSLGTSTSWRTVFAHPPMIIIVGVILLYFALENCLEFWPEPYIRELGYQQRGQRIGMLFFWLSFIATRGVAAWWLYEHPNQGFGLMFVLTLLSGLIVGNLAGGYEVGSGTVGFILAGAVYGPLLPGCLGMAFALFPDLPVSALGALLALSGLDTLVVRPLLGIYGKGRPPRTVMRVPTVLALILAAPLLLLAFMHN